MRTTKALILGVLLMPWLADMRDISAAIAAQPAARSVTPRSRDEIPLATAPTLDEMYQREPRRADIWEFERRVRSGELTQEEAAQQYRQKWGIPEPDPPLPYLKRRSLPGLNREWDR